MERGLEGLKDGAGLTDWWSWDTQQHGVVGSFHSVSLFVAKKKKRKKNLSQFISYSYFDIIAYPISIPMREITEEIALGSGEPKNHILDSSTHWLSALHLPQWWAF